MIAIYIFLVLFLISFILGIFLHELGHKIFCHLTGVEVIGVSYFNTDALVQADGFVMHKPPKTFIQALLISIGPMFTVGIVAFFIVFFLFKNPQFIHFWFFLIAISYGLLMSIFPSTHDINNLIIFVNKNYKFSFKTALIWILMPVIYLLRFLSYIHIKIILLIVLIFILIILSSQF